MWTRPLVLLSTMCVGVLGASALAAPAIAAPPSVQVVALPIPAGAQGTVGDIDDAGHVAGSIRVDGVQHAVRWDGLHRVALAEGTHAGSGSDGWLVNAAGTVAGYTYDSTQIATFARVWLPDGTVHDCAADPFSITVAGLNSKNQMLWRYREPYGRAGSGLCDADGTATALQLTDAYDLDEQGRAAGGQGFPPPGGQGAFHFVPAVAQVGQDAVTLPIPAGTDAEAFAFGPAGSVVGATGTVNYGSYFDITFVPQRAVGWIGGRMVDLGTLGGTYSSPLSGGGAVNRIGDVIGNSTTAAGDLHAFRWRLGRMTDLGTLGGTRSTVASVNDLGQVVGQSTTADGQTHAFLWSNGRMIDLGTMGGSASSAADINDHGQIVGTVTRADGRHPVRWTVH
jgi:probable HAF family extracellular repeat protein/YD repeat-containing protein